MKTRYFLLAAIILLAGCKKSKDNTEPPVTTPLAIRQVEIGSTVLNTSGSTAYNVPVSSVLKVKFNKKIERSTAGNIILSAFGSYPVNLTYENGDSTVVLTPQSPLLYLVKYKLEITASIKGTDNSLLDGYKVFNFVTEVDPSDKFPMISDNALLDTVQKRTFAYFWDYGHPVSGLARERSNSGSETVTSGGSGFGIMSIPVAISRNFITRAQGLARMQTIVGFLKNNAQKFHGAFPHWLNGTTGAVIPFSANDDGADLVETSYLMAGLLTARQYFDGVDVPETNLRNDINALWNAVEWNWFRQGSQNVLYWHWSPNVAWQMNLKIQGWNECLITYILAASSTTYGIPKAVYTDGFARNGAMQNGGTFFGYPLPLGPNTGGPLFLAHYSFLGINPNGLSDTYANYQTQVVNHTRINYEYCKANPKGFYGYSSSSWGLTASDVPNGYNANEPNNDIGVISPTAALSSFPYTPAESMNALKYFYYKLGDRTWKSLGFVDAFSLKDVWFANSHLAIDQGPIIIMIENYRTGLVWNLLTSCPEIKNGMKNVLGFSAPYL